MENDNNNKALEPEVMPKGPQEEIVEELKGYARTKDNPTAKKYINWLEFKTAAQRFMPLKDIAPFLGLHRDTLNNRCKSELNMTSAEVWEYFASRGKRVLASKMYDTAMGKDYVNPITKEVKVLLPPNFAAQAWLSKNFLGMREPEKQEPKTGSNSTPKEIIYKPTVKGHKDLEEKDIKKMMARYLDLPGNHKLKTENPEVKIDEPE